ncbi:MAG TPA: glycosyltransferase family 2 protein [Candidatus Levybacteria bacterium]|nr:glycosyltransferase family 2 protein [Candidatus Levybacteria bacterium]
MISVVISAYNEEKNIAACIESVENLADEIIVVDNMSTDATALIAKKSGAKVYSQENNPKKIDLQKNYGFEKATEEWILSLDADERVTQKLSQEIKNVLQHEDNTNAYLIPRKNIIFGKWIRNSIWWPDYQLRLFKKGKGKFLKASVHKQLEVKGETKYMNEPITHYNYDSISQYVSRMNNIYTEIEADTFMSEGKKLHWTEAIRMPASDFMKTYFFQKGYRDGLHGLILSSLQAFYMFLVFAKIWERQGFYERDSRDVLEGVGRELHVLSKDATFWMLKAMQENTRNPFKKAIYICARKLNKI